jgi:hypothetical protein
MNRFLRPTRGALVWLIRHEGVELTCGAETHRAYQGNVANAKGLDLGGFTADNVTEFSLVRDDWTTLPAIGNKVTVGSTTYRVKATTTSDNDPCVTLGCGGDDI